jgi:hypothetical protein
MSGFIDISLNPLFSFYPIVVVQDEFFGEVDRKTE